MSSSAAARSALTPLRSAAWRERVLAGGVVISGATGSDRIGLAVDAAGDINADGYDDLLIGGYTNSVYLIWGSPTRLVSDTITNAMAYRFTGSTGQRAGQSVAMLGDANGDGFGDFVVSAHRDDEGASDGGAAFVVYGSNTWFDEVDTDAEVLHLREHQHQRVLDRVVQHVGS